MKDKPHDEAMAEYFRANPAYAEQLLTEARRDGDVIELAILERQMREVFEDGCSGIAFNARSEDK